MSARSTAHHDMKSLVSVGYPKYAGNATLSAVASQYNYCGTSNLGLTQSLSRFRELSYTDNALQGV